MEQEEMTQCPGTFLLVTIHYSLSLLHPLSIQLLNGPKPVGTCLSICSTVLGLKGL